MDLPVRYCYSYDDVVVLLMHIPVTGQLLQRWSELQNSVVIVTREKMR
jgi:hypothetical protein